MRKILILSLVFRLLLAPWTYHGDSIEFLNWGKNLQEFGTQDFYLRDTPDASHPNYPPGFYLVLLATQNIYQAAKNFLWNLNVWIKIFPSNLYLWFESDYGRILFNKFPAIFADIGLGYLIYLFVKDIKNQNKGIAASSLFLLSPPIWYNSAVWGSTESIFALPLAASLYAIYKKKLILAAILFMVAFLIKPTVLVTLPIFALSWLKSVNFSLFIKTAFIAIPLFYLIHIPFNTSLTPAWIINLYKNNVLREVLGYFVANAFNFWGLLFGFEPKLDSSLIVGIPGRTWGYFIFTAFAGYFVWKLRSKISQSNILLATALLSFAGFLFLTRVHERYFYLTLLFLAPLAGFRKNIKNVFWLLSGIHLVNLYHFWWVPRIDFLVNFFSSRIVEQSLILINIGAFVWLFRTFQKDYAKA